MDFHVSGCFEYDELFLKNVCLSACDTNFVGHLTRELMRGFSVHIQWELNINWCLLRFRAYHPKGRVDKLCVFYEFSYNYISRTIARKIIKLHIKLYFHTNWCWLHVCVYCPTAELLFCIFNDFRGSCISTSIEWNCTKLIISGTCYENYVD